MSRAVLSSSKHCRAVTVPRRCNNPPARRKHALEQNWAPPADEFFFSPVLTGSPLSSPACRWPRSPLACGVPVFLDPASRSAAAKLLPIAVRVWHSPIRLPKVVNPSNRRSTHPIRSSERPSDLRPRQKVLQRSCSHPLVTFFFRWWFRGPRVAALSLARFPQGVEDVKLQRGEAAPHFPFW